MTFRSSPVISILQSYVRVPVSQPFPSLSVSLSLFSNGRSLTYPNIRITAGRGQPSATVWFKVCGVDGIVIVVPGHEQWRGLHVCCVVLCYAVWTGDPCVLPPGFVVTVVEVQSTPLSSSAGDVVSGYRAHSVVMMCMGEIDVLRTSSRRSTGGGEVHRCVLLSLEALSFFGWWYWWWWWCWCQDPALMWF